MNRDAEQWRTAGRGRKARARDAATLSGLGVLFESLPRVARSSQPWALGRNPFGIELARFVDPMRVRVGVRETHEVGIADPPRGTWQAFSRRRLQGSCPVR